MDEKMEIEEKEKLMLRVKKLIAMLSSPNPNEVKVAIPIVQTRDILTPVIITLRANGSSTENSICLDVIPIPLAISIIVGFTSLIP